jgi:plasmid stability protein
MSVAVKTLNLPDELWEALDSRAAFEGRSRSNMAARLLSEPLRVDVFAEGVRLGKPRALRAAGVTPDWRGGKKP